MLVEVVQMPSAYKLDIDPLSDVGKLTSGLRYRDLVERLYSNKRLILVVDANEETGDIGGKILFEIAKQIRGWHPKYSQRAEIYLKQLGKEHRVVAVPLDQTQASPPSSQPYCLDAIALARHIEAKLLVTPETCLCGNDCIDLATRSCPPVGEVSSADEMSETQVIKEEIRITSEMIKRGEPAKERLERRVWRPLFRYAKKIDIYDRYIGVNFVDSALNVTDDRKIVEFLKNQDSGKRGSLQFAAHEKSHEFNGYLNTLKDIVDYIKHYSLSASRITVCIHTSISPTSGLTYVGKEKIRAAALRLHLLAEEWSTDQVRIEMDLVQLGKGEAHDRFVVTDQFQITTGKGVTLWDDNGRSKEVTIAKVDFEDVPMASYGEDKKHYTKEELIGKTI